MNEESGHPPSVDRVVQFRSRPAVKESVPYLTDPERLALRRLIALEERIALAIKKLDHLEMACPTARREIRAMLVGD